MPKGKEDVLCTVCEQRMRKDTVTRHWNNKHKVRLSRGEKPAWKLPTKGVNPLEKLGFSQKQDVGGVAVEVHDEDMEGEDDIDMEEENNNEETEDKNKEDREYHSDAESPPSKKIKVDAIGNFMKKFEQKIDDMGNNLKAQIDRKFENLEKANKEKTVESTESSSESLSNIVINCKDIDQLDEKLVKLGLKKEHVKEDYDGYYCDICFEDTNPDWNNLHGVSGAFLFNVKEDCEDNSDNQSRVFRNLKINIKLHLERKTHQLKLEVLRRKERQSKEIRSRQKSIGMNIFRIRYQGIKQGKSRTNFEEDILTARLNKVDVGDQNHSRKFAKKLDDGIYSAMKAMLKDNLNNKLDATEEKRPAGLIMDKMTPRRRTGQIHGIVIPIPENPLTQDLLVPLMLEVPPAKVLTADGLAKTAKEIFNEAGFSDDRLEGVGWDGEYETKGVKRKLLERLDIPDRSVDDLDKWVTSRWEPAHQLELATKDVKKEVAFDWFEEHIKIVNDTTNVLNIGKGLEQSLEASEEVGEKFYKLKAMSDTRFSAYFEASLKAFEKRIDTTIAALRKRQLSKEKDVKEKSTWLLKKILNKKFFIINLALIDLYALLGSCSSSLQTVEQFPWEIEKKQNQLIESLKKMSNLKLKMNEETGEMSEIDQSLWPILGAKLDSVIDNEYVQAETALDFGRRRGRSAEDFSPNLDLLTTAENRIKGLCKSLTKHLERRLKDTPTPQVIDCCSKCLDIEDILEKEEDDKVKKERERNLKNILSKAKYDTEKANLVLKEYEIFKMRLKDVANVEGEFMEVVKRFEHILFRVHSCLDKCPRICPDKGKPLLPRSPIPMKLLHLFLKEPILYNGIQSFLHLYLR